MNFKDYIASISGFPQEGILFRDITPLMTDGKALKEACNKVVDLTESVKASAIVGPEPRSFIFGCPVAYGLGTGSVSVRKPGKLPRETASVSYDLEYGSNGLHVHRDGVKRGQRVLIVSDLPTIGGTVGATIQIVQELGEEVTDCASLIELAGSKGREHLKDFNVFFLISYE